MQHDFILLDRSQSMDSHWSEALAAVNTYVAKLAADKVDTGVTLAVFDTVVGQPSFDILRDRIIPSTWHPVETREAFPRGMTPLYDSVAKIVHLAEQGNYSKVAIIIMTDGEENSSKEYDRKGAADLLDKCRAKDWAVIFLGASFDNRVQAAGLGATRKMSVPMSAGNYVSTINTLSAKRGLYASGAATMDSMEFSDAELAEAVTPAPVWVPDPNYAQPADFDPTPSAGSPPDSAQPGSSSSDDSAASVDVGSST